MTQVTRRAGSPASRKPVPAPASKAKRRVVWAITLLLVAYLIWYLAVFATQKEAIREAVFRYQRQTAGPQALALLALDNGQATASGGSTSAGSGTIQREDHLRLLLPVLATVDGKTYRNGRPTSTHHYVVVRTRAGWAVSSGQLTWLE